MAAVAGDKMFLQAFPEFVGPHVKTYINCAARRLVVKDGTVHGVRAQPKRVPPFTAWARKGVIIASGGFGANPALRRRFQIDPYDMSIYFSLSAYRGDGQLLGEAVGGELINMTMIPPIVAVASRLIEASVAVNLDSRRFHDEAGPYYNCVYEVNKQREKEGHYIFNSLT